MALFLSDFSCWRPPFETAQEETLKWLIAVRRQYSLGAEEEYARVSGHAAIAKRGHISSNEERRALLKSPLEEKMRFFQEAVKAPFDALLPDEMLPPDELIHVTCTGYTAPSAAERHVIGRGWGEKTQVTHLYHMGCYAAIPAIRVAAGFQARGKRSIIIHTECCTLHSNPAKEGIDQRVIETLFGDGFIRYTVGSEGALEVIATREELIPHSLESMQWIPGEKQFQMTLSREVPVAILTALEGFLSRLGETKGALFAIHPGGPKIIDKLKERLHLSEEQIYFSRKVLKECGNVSSATLPHIWHEMVKAGVRGKIVSLAFGPGLKIAGAILCG